MVNVEVVLGAHIINRAFSLGWGVALRLLGSAWRLHGLLAGERTSACGEVGVVGFC